MLVFQKSRGKVKKLRKKEKHADFVKKQLAFC